MVSYQEEEIPDSPISPEHLVSETSPDGNEVAWNVVNLGQMQASERQSLFDEVRLAQTLEHPNILRCMDVWVNAEKHQLVFITELMSGGSLWTYLTKKIKQPRLSMIKHWCLDILRGLEYLHSHEPFPIMHRDLKCDNIFVRAESGQLVIGDFGFSKLMQNKVTATVLGTSGFMAPEILEGSYDLSADIYAFGMCVLEMSTAQRPYQECAHMICVYDRVLNHLPPQALSQLPDPELRRIVEDCIGPAPSRPSASELLHHPFFQSSPDTPRGKRAVPISITLCGPNGKKSLVSFDYDAVSDTPEGVSEEMVEQLKLDGSMAKTIAKEIARRLTPALPAACIAEPANANFIQLPVSKKSGRASVNGSPRNQCRVLTRNQSHENLCNLTHMHYDLTQNVLSPAKFIQTTTTNAFVW